MTTSAAPMVGASGALFGLAADWLMAEVRQTPRLGAQLLRGAGLIILLLALNALVWVLQGGQLAWETHLGGFLAGLTLALSWRSRS
ncbi:MAG: rhomboid family intramembrane serine protease [Rhodobacteraceae bacterium]|nr:rhomboid family intramembrane serine protease [Paracoccaceae bacterium]